MYINSFNGGSRREWISFYYFIGIYFIGWGGGVVFDVEIFRGGFWIWWGYFLVFGY